MIPKFMLNATLQHVGMSWIIYSNEEMKYEMDKNIHSDWLNKGRWYNTAICSRFHESLFEYFITHSRTNRHNILCCLAAHNKKQPACEY